MFIGHFGAGLAGKKPGKNISLGTLFMASQWLDLIWPILLIFKIELVSINPGDTKMTPLRFEHYPITHSLLFVILWSFLFCGVYLIIKKSFRNALILGLLIISHWVLDLIVHRPDLPLYPGGPLEGFGLWNSPFIEVIVEFLIFFGGVYIYISTTKSKDKIGVYSFWSLIIFLILVHIINLFSPPPPNAGMIGYVGLSTWLLVLWAYWIDKHRVLINN